MLLPPAARNAVYLEVVKTVNWVPTWDCLWKYQNFVPNNTKKVIFTEKNDIYPTSLFLKHTGGQLSYHLSSLEDAQLTWLTGGLSVAVSE